MQRHQAYSYSLHYTLLAEAAGVSLKDLFCSPEQIVWVYRRAQDDLLPPDFKALFADQLRVPVIGPTGYGHVSALGAHLHMPEHGEPWPQPVLSSPEEVCALREPEDYLNAGIMPVRREMADRIARLWGREAKVSLSASWEGPVTTAVLLAGPDFLTWPYHHPEAAHELLSFCTRSAVHFMQVYYRHEGWTWPPQSGGLCDDFAGMFRPPLFEEFVLPYWDEYYHSMGCSQRFLHSELLRQEHLSYLPDMHITTFDPGADQYLNPELLREHCPVPFQVRVQFWHLRDLPAETLQAMYRSYARCGPVCIDLSIETLDTADKFRALLETARELSG